MAVSVFHRSGKVNGNRHLKQFIQTPGVQHTHTQADKHKHIEIGRMWDKFPSLTGSNIHLLRAEIAHFIFKSFIIHTTTLHCLQFPFVVLTFSHKHKCTHTDMHACLRVKEYSCSQIPLFCHSQQSVCQSGN